MRILIAPDKFKGSLAASEVAASIAAGLHEAMPQAKIDSVPMADGGEGTAEILCAALGAKWVNCFAHDPLGRTLECRYGYVDEEKLAIMEMSEAAGMRRLSPNERDLLRATTFGVGEMILDAIRRGAAEIIIGLGGSATNDGGFGMARALNYRFFDTEGMQLRAAISKLTELKIIEDPPKLPLPRIVAAADVTNPLLGKHGAAHVFAAQKGGTPAQIEILERALKRLAKITRRHFGVDYRKQPGSGAAGGLGFGLMTFTGAIIRPGFDVVAEAVDLEARIEDADVVITGEGSLDGQTLSGKTPAGVAGLSRKLGKRVFAIVGRVSDEAHVRALFDDVIPLAGGQVNEKQSVTEAPLLLRRKAAELARRL